MEASFFNYFLRTNFFSYFLRICSRKLKTGYLKPHKFNTLYHREQAPDVRTHS